MYLGTDHCFSEVDLENTKKKCLQGLPKKTN